MRTMDTETMHLVMAAQRGDNRAMDDLVARYLPLIYNIVGRALGGHADVDDVVQETLLRVVRDLPDLRSPSSFRSWLVAIAMHQISGRLGARRTAAAHTTALTGDDDIPDQGADFADLTILRLDLSGQRRQVAEASRWLDSDDRELLSLWWLENAGELTRAEIAEALGISAAHAGVRIQRMRNQLESARTLVAALAATPGCPDLRAVATGWDGRPGSRWRKRFLRHVRDCARCQSVRESFLPTNRLLAGLGLVPLPAGLAGAVANGLGLGTLGVSAGITGSAMGGAAGATVAGLVGPATMAKPVAALIVGLTVAAGGAGAVYLATPGTTPAREAATAVSPAPVTPATTRAPAPRTAPDRTASAGATTTPSAAAPTAGGDPVLSPGRWAFQAPGTTRYIAYRDGIAVLMSVDEASPGAERAAATITVVPGLADPACLSLRTSDGRYLRHYDWQLIADEDQGTSLFRGDATFCARRGERAGTVRLQSRNYPDTYVYQRGDEVWVKSDDGTEEFDAISEFRLLRAADLIR